MLNATVIAAFHNIHIGEKQVKQDIFYTNRSIG